MHTQLVLNVRTKQLPGKSPKYAKLDAEIDTGRENEVWYRIYVSSEGRKDKMINFTCSWTEAVRDFNKTVKGGK